MRYGRLVWLGSSQQIDTVMNAQFSQQITQNRLRLNPTIESIRLLTSQGLAFRVNDESHDSSNQENFIELIKAFGRCNIEINNVVLDNALGNVKYIASSIQKEILHIFANKVRKLIREEVGNNKYCILVDEANKEQMTIILRYVDCYGFISERFFNIVSVPDTVASTLKNVISIRNYELKLTRQYEVNRLIMTRELEIDTGPALGLAISSVARLLVDGTVALAFPSKLKHRFSDEAEALLESRKVTFGEFVAEQEQLEYFHLLLRGDMKRQMMKQGSEYYLLSPSEGSETIFFGNKLACVKFGQCLVR
ncbi:hypothetical protein FNV43_RR12504 [Rhamnella rubrinervis]|uniref:DUF4371 domain-containing protein n=1 Tax=Rhamnella rubrinervis TaxID=2594499 RepID=A0A8K0H830_9ROSA|nr:hypothetical protein FNV43_RR12504 [Rhamnella rubrinervis]